MFTHFSKITGLILVVICFLCICAANVYASAEQDTGGLFDGSVSYTVQPGDTLSEIANTFNVDLNLLMRANNLNTTVIRPYQILNIPARDTDTIATSRGEVTREDFLLLARAINAEARGESFDGKVAIGAVILNRVESPYFPDTIKDVILQRNERLCQFTPVSNGTINLKPDEEALRAAAKALEGYDPTGGALFFYNPHISTDNWIKTLPVLTKIGKHVFATKA